MLSCLLSNRYFDLHRFASLLKKLVRFRRDRFLGGSFALLSYYDLARHHTELLGVDAAIYYRAALAFRLGHSPWDALVVGPTGSEYHFAALPPTVLSLVPFTVLSERGFVWLWLFLSVAAAFWVVRRLSLAWWWVMFPPLLQGVYAANPQIVLLALLLAGSSVLGSLAPMLKIYAFAPLIGERRYRALMLVGVLLGASWLLAPSLWLEYLDRLPQISARVMYEAHGGYSAIGYYSPALLVAALAGVALLAAVDFPAAGWLAGPAFVPASQFHLSTMALPVLVRDAPILFVLAMALPVQGVPPAAIAIYGFWRCYTFVRDRRLHVGTHE